MSKLMMVLGIALACIGVMLGIVGLISPSKLAAMFISLDTAVSLVVGGIVSFGLGGVIAALETMPGRTSQAAEDVNARLATAAYGRPLTPPVQPDPETEPATSGLRMPSIPGFGRKPVDAGDAMAAATAAAASAVAASAANAASTISSGFPPSRPEPVSPSVAETINALEQAKSDIRVALGVGNSPSPLNPSVAIPPPPGAPDEDEEITGPLPDVQEMAEPEAEAEPGELYVVEEKLVRGRPARILSDGTVEAETDEGWMRFENLEHLNEYLDG